ncbi:extracellular solute-binding protein [Paenibacillus sp. HWE-109]|uniref:extracellular solute-binding protein n=1 Tax=Paenibacillus sp. HWE-109 TaxID=1306526 RepID=UPI001EDD0F52|nr:extracellular solute-binding protein [Paenibacillus sp. HWE-109]UKS25095.1 extracellular solute-binding protein [Paenibacillus sp. HWE-109]
MNNRRLVKQAVLMLSLISVLSACSNSSNSSDVKSGKETDRPAKKATLKVEIFDRGNSPSGLTVTNNLLTKYVQDNFGTPNNIDVQFIPVPRSQEVQKLNVLMASGDDVPDIVFTYDSGTFYRYAQQGGLTDMTELLNQQGPNLKTYLGAETLQYGQVEGKQYSLPGKRIFLGKYANYIRKDWLDLLQLPVPKTTDELYTTLKAFKEKDPGKTGGKTIPFGMTIAPAQYDPLLWSFIKPMTEEQAYTLTQQLGSSDYPVLLPGFKDALKYMNKLYNEGLLSKDFGLDKDKKQLSQDTIAGKVGFFSEDIPNIYDKTDGVYAPLQNNTPSAVLTPVDPFTNSEGKHAKPAYSPTGLYIMIPKSSKSAAEAVRYLDWMSQKDHLFYMQNGVEGENFKLVDGLPVALDTPEAAKRVYNFGDMAIIANGKDLGDSKKNIDIMTTALPDKYNNDAKQSFTISLADTISPKRFDKVIEAEAKYGTTLLEKYKQLLVKTAMVKPDEFDKTYDSMLEDYLQNGGQAILDERKTAYAKKGK